MNKKSSGHKKATVPAYFYNIGLNLSKIIIVIFFGFTFSNSSCAYTDNTGHGVTNSQYHRINGNTYLISQPHKRIKSTSLNREISQFLYTNQTIKYSLDKCISKAGSEIKIDNLFATQYISLSKNRKTYLVLLGNHHCDEFIAAHLTQYWIVEKIEKYIIIDEGQCDEIKVIDSKSNGYRDLICQISYFSSFDKMIIKRFDGKIYK